MQNNYGATPQDWDHFSLILGLTADLLPVVSNPEAKISPDSKMKGLGKTPSRYNRNQFVAGISEWTSHQATPSDIENWRKQPDYGICLQTRTVRAFDIDIDNNEALAKQVIDAIGIALPQRFRVNSSKVLLAFSYEGELPKRVIRLDGGIVELLGSGQQFVACGTHPSGVHYQWLDTEGSMALPDGFPVLSLEEIDAIWSRLEAQFATAPSSSAAPSKMKKLAEAVAKDPTAQFLVDNGWVKSSERDGRLHITCPFEDGHSTVTADSSTSYFPANTGGYQFGHFACLHASCEHRTDDDFKAAIGVPYEDPFDCFENLDTPCSASPGVAAPDSGLAAAKETKKPRFTVVPAHEFAVSTPQRWIVKGVLPHAEMGVIYGESGSGKTFLVLDIVGSVVRGEEWRGHKVNQGGCVYIVAEGAGGFKNRLKAYALDKGVPLADLPIGVIPEAPNFMAVPDVRDVILAIRAFGKPSLVVVDTFAQVMAGSNENAGEDVGKALSHCKEIHKRTGAMVLLVHHSGKDASKGARGWSGLRAAAEFEMEVSRCDDDREAQLTKLKDGEDGATFGFKLRQLPVGMDEDDEVVTSCVVDIAEVKEAKVGPKAKKGSNERLVLQCLHSILEVGEDSVQYTDLVAACAREMVPPLEGKRDRRGELISQAVGTLRDRGDLVIDNGFVKLPAGGDDG